MTARQAPRVLSRALLFFLAAALGACAARPAPADHRADWWREARFGMFIHWGLYAIPAGEWDGKPAPGTGEWIMRNAKIPVTQYETLKDRFNPVNFDAHAWARLARTAGMKYLVITTKHHDGFALFDSATSDYDVMATPFKRDIMAELARACRDEGITPGWYHSILDWHHPDYLPRVPWDNRPASDADFNRYTAYLEAQVTELLTRYGPIGVMWFDGEWEDHWNHERGKHLYELCRRLQPGILVNNRVDKGRNDMAGLDREGEWCGDFGTPEQEVPSTGIPGVDWESCMTMNDTWGFRADDHNWKSATQLIRTLCDTAGKGGNFLLNVGPTADGRIPPESAERLEAIGRWMSVNSGAIYATSAGPFERLPWGRCTSKGSTLNLLVFDRPESGLLTVPGLLNDPRRAYALAEPDRPLRTRREGTNVIVDVSGVGFDPAATVIVLEMGSKPKVAPLAVTPISDTNGVAVLTPSNCRALPATPAIEHIEGVESFGYWTGPKMAARWRLSLPPGEYAVTAELACQNDSAGNIMDASFAGRHMLAKVPPTGSWQKFQTARLGSFVLTKAENAEFCVTTSGGKLAKALMNLRKITIQRVSPSHDKESE